MSSKENNSNGAISVASTEALVMSSPHRRSVSEPGSAASDPWERCRRSCMAPRRKEEPEKEEVAHQARMLTALQWRFANARIEEAMARATSAAENKLFYMWLRVVELCNIQAAKWIVAQRQRQKLKLARLLRPQLPLLASWEILAKAHDDATADLGRVVSTACTNLLLAAGARADMDELRETFFSCVGTVNEIEAITDMLYATVDATSGALGELAQMVQQEMECLEKATRPTGYAWSN